jgi:hypothetical protein
MRKALTVLVLLCVSMEVTPLLSVLTAGGGNLTQLIVVLSLTLIVLFCNIDKFKFISFSAITLFILGLLECALAFNGHESLAVSSRILMITLISVVLYNHNFRMREFSFIFYKFTDAIVLINVIGLMLAYISFDAFTHPPLSISDESVFRKVDYNGELKLLSVGFTNFLIDENGWFNFSPKNYISTGLSAEPHAFFSFVFTGLCMRTFYLGPKQNLFIIALYVVSLLLVASFSNIIALCMVAIVLILVWLDRKLSNGLSYLCLSALVVSIILVSLSNLEIFNYSGVQGIDRSALQTIMSIERLFDLSFNLGLVTVGPDIVNDYKLSGVFIINGILFWMFLSQCILNMNNKKKASSSNQLVLDALTIYLLVYSFKNAGYTIFIPYILLFLLINLYPNKRLDKC